LDPHTHKVPSFFIAPACEKPASAASQENLLANTSLGKFELFKELSPSCP
jgi:hypothetical protein